MAEVQFRFRDDEPVADAAVTVDSFAAQTNAAAVRIEPGDEVVIVDVAPKLRARNFSKHWQEVKLRIADISIGKMPSVSCLSVWDIIEGDAKQAEQSAHKASLLIDIDNYIGFVGAGARESMIRCKFSAAEQFDLFNGNIDGFSDERLEQLYSQIVQAEGRADDIPSLGAFK